MKYLFIATLVAISSSNVSAHKCHVKMSNEMSMHFKDVSLMKALHIISSFSDKNLLIETKRDITIPLHYNCEKWNYIIRDLDKKFDFKIYVSGGIIVVKDKY